MAIYAIGDLQGCYDELQRLLEQIDFNPVQDKLWFVGDLVNRGPQSLECLRFVMGLKDSAVTVLGNHDLHLLAVAAGADVHSKKDTLDTVLSAADREELLHWLRRQPLVHYDQQLAYLMIHAGLCIQWSVADAVALSQEVSNVLSGADYKELLLSMYGNKPERWSESLLGIHRLRFIINACTRMRFCSTDGTLDFHEKGPPRSQANGLFPWYQLYPQQQLNCNIIFGHWSTLSCIQHHKIRSLDSGCVWGGRLSALRIDVPNASVSSVDCDPKQPHD